MGSTAADNSEGTSHHGAFALVVVASSAGGLRALRTFFSDLSPDLPAAFVVVQHLAPWYKSQLVRILSACTKLGVEEAGEGTLIRPGTVYIAPPNKHVLVNPDGTLSLSFSELVHFLRPSADLLFESAAASFKDRTICVVLTGTGSDGTMGAQAVKKMGGIVIAQDEATSEFFGMPSAVIGTGVVDFVLGLDDIAARVRQLTVGDVIDD